MPEGSETLTLTLASPSGATIGDNEATGTVTDPAPPALTAEFRDVPREHDGSSTFTVEVHFSEAPKISYRTVRDHLFTVGGGKVTRARRVGGACLSVDVFDTGQRRPILIDRPSVVLEGLVFENPYVLVLVQRVGPGVPVSANQFSVFDELLKRFAGDGSPEVIHLSSVLFGVLVVRPELEVARSEHPPIPAPGMRGDRLQIFLAELACAY